MPRALLDVPSPYGVEVKAALYAGGARDAAICMAWGQAIMARRICTQNQLGGGVGSREDEPVHGLRGQYIRRAPSHAPGTPAVCEVL